MTECTQSSFEFAASGSRQVVARFDGGTMSSDGGSLLLRETDRRLNLLPRLAACFQDRRDLRFITHSLSELVAQRHPVDPLGNQFRQAVSRCGDFLHLGIHLFC